MGYPTPGLLNFIQTKRQRFCVLQHLPVNPAIYQQVIVIKQERFNMQELIEIFHNITIIDSLRKFIISNSGKIFVASVFDLIFGLSENIFKPDLAAEGILEHAITKAHYCCSSVIR